MELATGKEPGKKMLSADDILNAPDEAYDVLHIPEWGGSVCIKVMSGIERDTWEHYAGNELAKKGQSINVRAKLAALCICDENGKLLFNHAQVMELGKKSAKALDRVYSAATKLNRLTDADLAEIEGN